MGNQQSFYDLPDSKEETTEHKVIPVKEVLQKYIEKIFPNKAHQLTEELEDIKDELEHVTEYLEYDTPTEIVTRGEPADAIYIILEGDADVLIPGEEEGDEEEVISICSQHDCIGDDSIFFDKACYHTVVVHEGACVLRTEAADVHDSSLTELVNKDYYLDQYMIARKQLPVPDMEDINAHAVNATIVAILLRQTTLLRQWTDDLLKALVLQLEEPWVEVYPPDSIIAEFGDKPNAMFMLIRGNVVAKDRSDVDIMPLIVRRYPFCFGEEGLFDESWYFPYTITADCTCQFLRVRLEDIEAITQQYLEENPEKTEFKFWEDSCELWQSVKLNRDDAIHEKYLPRLQVEFVYRSLRASNVLPINIYSTRCTYHIAMSGQCMELQLGQGIECDEELGVMVMVIDGIYGIAPETVATEKLRRQSTLRRKSTIDRRDSTARRQSTAASIESLKPMVWVPRQVVDCRDNMADLSSMVALEVPCVVVRFFASEINAIKQQYSQRRGSFL